MYNIIFTPLLQIEQGKNCPKTLLFRRWRRNSGSGRGPGAGGRKTALSVQNGTQGAKVRRYSV